MNFSTFAMVTIFLLMSTNLSKDRDVSGMVLDINRMPITGVRVHGYRHFSAGGSTAVEATTDANGSFTVDHVGPALSFYKDGYQPSAVLLSSETRLTVTLKAGAPTDWHVPECTQAGGIRRYGAAVSFGVPSKAKVQVHSGEDTVDAVVFFPAHKREKMLIWYGPMMGAFSVPEEFILNSSPLSIREVLIHGIVHGTDAHGTDQSGKKWRFVGVRDRAEYRSVSNEAAHFFDQIIDSACVPPGTTPIR